MNHHFSFSRELVVLGNVTTTTTYSNRRGSVSQPSYLEFFFRSMEFSISRGGRVGCCMHEVAPTLSAVCLHVRAPGLSAQAITVRLTASQQSPVSAFAGITVTLSFLE